MKMQMRERFLAMKAKQKLMLVALLLTVISGFAGKSLYVQAEEEATVTFGSNWYNKKSGDTFPVGVYLKAEEAIGDYYIEIEYDYLRLEYVKGADEVDQENGVLILAGNQNGKTLKFFIQFKAISGGEALIEITSAEVMLRDSEGAETFTITAYGSAPVHISGEDTAASIEAQLEQEARQAEAAIRAEEAKREAERARQAEREEREGEKAQQAEKEAEREQQAEEKAENDRKAPATIKKKKTNYIFFNVYFVFALATILMIVILDVVVWSIIKRVRAKRKKSFDSPEDEDNRKPDSTGLKIIDLDSPDFDMEDLEAEIGAPAADDPFTWMNHGRTDEITLTSEEELEWQLGRPIIKISDVTMEFKLYSVNPSGIKEYAVQLLKREVSYRRLYALYHVSFNVFKGEVIGIIGTNGSGKSTLLKIVAGALKPTEGHVEITGRRKVQLLTIGTGFDMELTARENVFLNGSIIGYSKKFLETHYDEIVEFAELQDFMEQKVKNFSSGMVSRLGFAIATAGKAAEILILDEILSVGDEFFREKSLKRVKEMIHGGSTVLMVSHSMGTILENCSRCVWIEKGVLKMVGEPKVVCGEYRRLNGER